MIAKVVRIAVSWVSSGSAPRLLHGNCARLRWRRTVRAARCAIPAWRPDGRVQDGWCAAARFAGAHVLAHAQTIPRAWRRWICPSRRCRHARLTGQAPLGRLDVIRHRLHLSVRATAVAASTPSIAIRDFSRQQTSLRVESADFARSPKGGGAGHSEYCEYCEKRSGVYAQPVVRASGRGEKPQETEPFPDCCSRRPTTGVQIWTPVGLRRLHSGGRGNGKCMKRFGGPGEIRTHDLFHAMEARSQLRHRPAELFSIISYGEVRRNLTGRFRG